MQDLSGLDEMVSVLQSRQLALLVILTAACTSYLLSTWMKLAGKKMAKRDEFASHFFILSQHFQ